MHAPLAMLLASCRATADERTRLLPGDSLVPAPMLVSTHAITIDAPPERIWPWLAQMGGGRAGWYSWDRIDNGGIPSACHVIGPLQRLAVGDIMPAVPGATDAFLVAAVNPPHDLVLGVPDSSVASWEHFLEPLGMERCRLIARSRISGDWIGAARNAGRPGRRPSFIEHVYRLIGRLPRPLLAAAVKLGHGVMESRHLRGIKRRAESREAIRWVERLRDRRSGRVVLLSHCLLDENTRYPGGACRPGCVGEVVRQCLEREVGIVQLPCPEQHAWGGVRKRHLLRLAGTGRGKVLAALLRRVITPLAIAHTRSVYRRLARGVARQIEDTLRSGMEVVGIVAVDGSPSCGLERTMDLRTALPALARMDRASMSAVEMNALVRGAIVPGTGLFVAELERELRRRGCHVPFLAHDLLEELAGRRSGVQLPVAPGAGARTGTVAVPVQSFW